MWYFSCWLFENPIDYVGYFRIYIDAPEFFANIQNRLEMFIKVLVMFGLVYIQVFPILVILLD